MINNKIKVLAMGIMVTLLFAACSSGESASSEESSSSNNAEYTLEFGSLFSTLHHAHSNVYEPWVELVEEKTDGRVSVEIHAGSVLGGTETTFEDISSGVYDVGMISIPHFLDTAFFPYSILTLPGVFQDVEIANKVSQRFAEEYYQEEAFKDVVSLGIYTTDPNVLLSSTPIEGIDDLQGLNIHILNPMLSDVVRAWGANPVTMDPADVYQALERGIVDASIFTPVGAEGYSYQEVAPYVLEIGLISNSNFMAMNRNKFESFPEDIQAAFEDGILDFMSDAYTESYFTELERVMEIYEEGVNGKGGVITFSTEEQEKLLASTKIAWDDWVEDANARGYDGEKIMEDFLRILEEEGVEVPF